MWQFFFPLLNCEKFISLYCYFPFLNAFFPHLKVTFLVDFVKIRRKLWEFAYLKSKSKSKKKKKQEFNLLIVTLTLNVWIKTVNSVCFSQLFDEKMQIEDITISFSLFCAIPHVSRGSIDFYVLSFTLQINHWFDTANIVYCVVWESCLFCTGSYCWYYDHLK